MLDASHASPAYRLARGVRLRLSADGASLLVPEGIVSLSETAAAILELVDGRRDAEAIATLLAERFDAPLGDLARDVDDMLAALRERGFLQS